MMNSGEPSKAKRGLVVLLGLTASCSVLVLALSLVLPSSRRESVFKRESASGTTRGGAGAPVPVNSSSARPSPASSSTTEVAKAMDLSNVRAFLLQLQVAAAKEDQSTMKNVLGALRRYRVTAAPLIREAMRETENPKVRAALEDALAQAF